MNQKTTIDADSVIVSQVIKGGMGVMNSGVDPINLISMFTDLGGTFLLLFTVYLTLVGIRADLRWEWNAECISRTLGICTLGTVIAKGIQECFGTYVGTNLQMIVGILAVSALTTQDIRGTVLNVLKPLGNFIIALLGRKPLSDEDLNYKGASHSNGSKDDKTTDTK